MRTALVAFVFAACSHGARPAAQPAVASQCKTAADHLVEMMPGAAEAPPDKIKEIHDIIAKHCDDDHWSAEAQQCLVTMKTKAEGEQCAAMLTDAQNTAIGGELQRKEDAATGGGGPPKAEPASSIAPGAPPPPPKPADAKPARRTSDPCEGGQ
jgi:hypothetical protein